MQCKNISKRKAVNYYQSAGMLLCHWMVNNLHDKKLLIPASGGIRSFLMSEIKSSLFICFLFVESAAVSACFLSLIESLVSLVVQLILIAVVGEGNTNTQGSWRTIVIWLLQLLIDSDYYFLDSIFMLRSYICENNGKYITADADFKAFYMFFCFFILFQQLRLLS